MRNWRRGHPAGLARHRLGPLPPA